MEASGPYLLTGWPQRHYYLVFVLEDQLGPDSEPRSSFISDLKGGLFIRIMYCYVVMDTMFALQNNSLNDLIAMNKINNLIVCFSSFFNKSEIASNNKHTTYFHSVHHLS